MNIYEGLLKRRSVRKFLGKKVEDEKILELLKGAMAAPSAVNSQPWEFYVIKNEEVLKELKGATPYTNMNSPLIFIVAGNSKRFLPEESEIYWIEDCSAAIQSLLLAAVDLDLGTCWCAIYPKSEGMENVRKALKLDESIVPLALIHVGYPEIIPEARTQYNEEFVHIIE